MKKYLYSLFTALTATVVFSGCGEFLDTVPDERTQLDNVDKVEALLTSAYPDRSFTALVHYRCDNITDFGSTYTGSQPMPLLAFAGEEYAWVETIQPNGNDTEEDFWTACYKAIAAANHALEALEALPGEGSEAALGEAYMARAFSHFYLASLFSELYNPATAALYPGIPYVTDPEDVPIKMYSRGTVADTYAMIERDIEAGFPRMTDGTGFHAPKYHFGRSSAAAFATRFYLMKGDYAKVVSYANMIFPTPASFVDITNSAGDPIKNADGTPVKNVDPTDAAIVFAASNFHPFVASYSSMSSPYSIMDAFSSSSNPANLLLCAPKTSLGVLNSSYYSRFGMDINDVKALLFAETGAGAGSWIFENVLYGQELAYFPKHNWDTEKSSISSGSGVPYSVMPLLRIEELLLNRAEAYVMLDDFDKAIADINVFLSQRIVTDPYSAAGRVYDPKAYYLSKDRALEATADERGPESFINKYNDTASWPELKKALIVLLLRYRNVEFWQEGLRWYDIRRWNIPVKHTFASGESDMLAPGDSRRLLQIPESAQLAGVERNER